ncbi:MAG TPA: DUF4870 domain-containing protein [Aggregatilineales bacterium]|nr:DUF4870 domain-containing protein [Aggregatilineales bacterium]HPV05686.1 DUF4870 domain-containing protein [Aggregatilineales bacterium]HQA67974.1 DUF4870 domain-containing protein [Aggregatilineales bacterium]
MTENTEQTNGEARLLAALAHGSIIAQWLGLIVGVIVYATQRERSRYAAFQGLQAAVYQLFSLIVAMVVWSCWMVFYLLTWIPLATQIEASDTPPPLFWVGLGSMIIPLIVMAILGLYGLWGGVRCLQGHDFRYIVIGPLLERSGIWQRTTTRPDTASRDQPAS